MGWKHHHVVLAEEEALSHHGWCQSHRRCGRRAWTARRGAELVRRMHVDIACGRLHVWPWFVENDFEHEQSSIKARPSVGCVTQYFKACSEWKSAPTRTWGWTAKGVGYLHTHGFDCCLAVCPRIQRCGWRVFVDWDYKTDRVDWPTSCTGTKFARQPWHLQFWQFLQSEPGRREMASRPSKFDFWIAVQSAPGQSCMACRPSKFDFWTSVQSEPGQSCTSCRPSKLNFWKRVRSEPGQREMASRPSKFDFWTSVQSEPGQSCMACRPSKLNFWRRLQSERGQREMDRMPSKFDFWISVQSEPGQSCMACRPSKRNFWRRV